MKTADVVLIGSGISSLTCALLLAKKGKRVVVLEQHMKPGGYMHCFQRFGERFDTGAHYVGAMDPGHPFHTLLNYLGVYDEDHFTPLDPTGFDVFHFPEFTARMPKGYEETIAEVTRLFPNEQKAIRAYFAAIQEAIQYFPTYQFDDARIEIPATRIFETSLQTVVEGLTQNPGLQSVLYAYCALHAVNPEDVPFGFHAIVTDSLIRSPYGLKHGGDALATRFKAEIEKLGGEVLMRKRVSKIKVKDRNVTQVETENGEIYQAEWVVSGLHVRTTLNLIDDQNAFPSVLKDRIKNLRESVGLFGVSAMVEGDFSPFRNYYFFDTSEPGRFLRVGKPDETPAAIFMSPSRRSIVADKALPINLHSAGPVEWFKGFEESKYGKRADEYKALKLQVAENSFRVVERYYPGFRKTVKNFTASTPLTNIHFNGSPEGTAYGLYHSIQNTGARAIGPRTKVLNLLLTGQNCLFPGLLGAAISGLRTAGHMIGIKPILGELKELARTNSELEKRTNVFGGAST